MRALAAQLLEHRRALIDAGDHRAVLWRGGVNIVRGVDAARARHVLNNDVWLAGNVGAIIAGQQARIEIIPAARAETDDDIYILARIEGGWLLRVRGAAKAAAANAANAAVMVRFVRVRVMP